MRYGFISFVQQMMMRLCSPSKPTIIKCTKKLMRKDILLIEMKTNYEPVNYCPEVFAMKRYRLNE
jgi:hypothetical protein